MTDIGDSHIRSRRSRVWLAAPVVSLALLFVTAFQWSLIDRWTPFLLMPALALLWLAQIAVAIWSVAHLVRNRADWRRSCVPALICLATYLLLTFVPFTQLWIQAKYVMTKKARASIVTQVLGGELRPNLSSALIALPPAAPSVSMGGNQVWVEVHDGHTYVLFYTFRGILDSYAGFLYVPVGSDPKLFGDLGEAKTTQIEQFDPEWYYISHH